MGNRETRSTEITTRTPQSQRVPETAPPPPNRVQTHTRRHRPPATGPRRHPKAPEVTPEGAEGDSPVSPVHCHPGRNRECYHCLGYLHDRLYTHARTHTRKGARPHTRTHTGRGSGRSGPAPVLPPGHQRGVRCSALIRAWWCRGGGGGCGPGPRAAGVAAKISASPWVKDGALFRETTFVRLFVRHPPHDAVVVIPAGRLRL